jgi:hypothetical protein
MLLKNKNLILSNSSRSISYLNALRKGNISLNHIIFYGSKKPFNLKKLPKFQKVTYFIEKKINKKIADFIFKTKLKQFIISPNKSEIINNNFLLKKLKIIHIHPGKLPEFKGSTTLYYSKLANKETICTCFRMKSSIDTGEILFKKKFKNSNITEKFFDRYDDYIRGITLVNFFKIKRIKRIKKTNKKKLSNYYIIHPLLRKLALNKKFKLKLKKYFKIIHKII